MKSEKTAKKRFTIVGNWKMNVETLEDAKNTFKQTIKSAQKAAKVSVVVAPSTPFIGELARVKQSVISLSAQDVAPVAKGALTGSSAASQVKTVGAAYTLIGHSERRAAGDTDEIIAQKIFEAVQAGLKVILCVGEKERDDQAQYLRVIHDQIVVALSKVDKKKLSWLTVAYEPIWAIGKSYDTALKPSDIHEMSIYIKKVIAELLGKLGKKDALKMPVLYGGSVNFENAQSILSEGAIDGLLIGRQSLDAEAFKNIMDYANNL